VKGDGLGYLGDVDSAQVAKLVHVQVEVRETRVILQCLQFRVQGSGSKSSRGSRGSRVQGSGF